MDINGTLIWYYFMCKREVWLMSRNIIPDQKDDNIDIGRFIHEQSYKRNDKEISFGNVKFDVIFKNKDKLVIGETKKSSKYEEASKWQLLFYLSVLKEAGIYAEGVLLYPSEKKRKEIILNEENLNKLNEIKNKINALIENDTPKPPKKIPLCKNCGYREYCFA